MSGQGPAPGSLPAVEEVARLLRERIGLNPEALVVLGSGLGGLAEAVDDPVEVRFDDLPGYPRPGVHGHGGRYVAGRVGGRGVLLQAGRIHAYEGHPMDVVVAPIRVASRLGARVVVLTNAAGAIDPGLGPGDLVVLDDHLDLTFRSPLRGLVREGELRFPDMSEPYDAELRALALEVAAQEGVRLVPGVYAGLLGPSYETPAEVRMLRRLGAHVVGMSTVPEALAAAALGLRCVAFSVVANVAVGLPGADPLDHREVVEVTERAGEALSRVVAGVLGRLPGAPQPAGAK